MGFKNNQWCKKTVGERFKEKYVVNETNGCWEWQGYKDKDGYGSFWFLNKRISAHIFSYIWYIGEINDKKLQVCHKCDNPCCVNPFHLFLGTQTDNFKDAQEKGRKPKAKHPSLSYYSNQGCRCDECVEIARKYWREAASRKREMAKLKKSA